MTIFAVGIAGLVIEGLSIVAFITIAVLAQQHIKGGFSDPVRDGLSWFKTALGFIIASLFLFLVSVVVAFTTYDPRPYSHIRGVCYLFWNFGVYSVLMSIATLAVGAHKVDNNQDSLKFITFARVVILLEGLLNIASFIFWRYLDSKDYGTNFEYIRSDLTADIAFAWISLIMDFLLVLFAIATTVFSCLKRNQARRREAKAGMGNLPAMRRVWEKIIPATSITIVTTVWGSIWNILGGRAVLYYSYNDDYHGYSVFRLSLGLVNVIISKWVLFVACVIIYLLGKKKQDGLWLIPQEEGSADKDTEGHVSA